MTRPTCLRTARHFTLPSKPQPHPLSPFHSLPYTPKHHTLSLSPHPQRSSHRPFHTAPTHHSTTTWSAPQYLQFATERTRPAHDLLARVTPYLPPTTKRPRIYDLGCGPGNSTRVLFDTFPSADITGVDSSPEMLDTARRSVPEARFVQAELEGFALPTRTTERSKDHSKKGGGQGQRQGQQEEEEEEEEEEKERREEDATLVFSSSTFHWLRHTTRLPTLTSLFAPLPPHAILALQLPDNYASPTHTLMRSVALQPNKPWSSCFATAHIGDVAVPTRPDLDPVEPPGAWFDALRPLAGWVDVWRTEYMHVLGSEREVVEWVGSTGLRPFLERIGEESVKGAFLDEYERGIGGVLERLGDGRVVLGYRRLFVVAVRK